MLGRYNDYPTLNSPSAEPAGRVISSVPGCRMIAGTGLPHHRTLLVLEPGNTTRRFGLLVSWPDSRKQARNEERSDFWFRTKQSSPPVSVPGRK